MARIVIDEFSAWNVAVRYLASVPYEKRTKDEEEISLLLGQYHYGIAAKRALLRKLLTIEDKIQQNLCV